MVVALVLILVGVVVVAAVAMVTGVHVVDVDVEAVVRVVMLVEGTWRCCVEVRYVVELFQ